MIKPLLKPIYPIVLLVALTVALLGCKHANDSNLKDIEDTVSITPDLETPEGNATRKYLVVCAKDHSHAGKPYARVLKSELATVCEGGPIEDLPDEPDPESPRWLVNDCDNISDRVNEFELVMDQAFLDALDNNPVRRRAEIDFCRMFARGYDRLLSRPRVYRFLKESPTRDRAFISLSFAGAINFDPVYRELTIPTTIDDAIIGSIEEKLHEFGLNNTPFLQDFATGGFSRDWQTSGPWQRTDTAMKTSNRNQEAKAFLPNIIGRDFHLRAKINMMSWGNVSLVVGRTPTSPTNYRCFCYSRQCLIQRRTGSQASELAQVRFDEYLGSKEFTFTAKGPKLSCRLGEKTLEVELGADEVRGLGSPGIELYDYHINVFDFSSSPL